jgi:hypothetical protein
MKPDSILQLAQDYVDFIKEARDGYKTQTWLQAGDAFKSLCLQGAGVACLVCRGTGTRTYSNTATWRGGMGGASTTSDVCDVCWGTGRTDKTGANLREMMKELEDARKDVSLKWLKERTGAGSNFHKPYFALIAKKIRGVKRWPSDDFWLQRTVEVVAKALEELGE